MFYLNLLSFLFVYCLSIQLEGNLVNTLPTLVSSDETENGSKFDEDANVKNFDELGDDLDDPILSILRSNNQLITTNLIVKDNKHPNGFVPPYMSYVPGIFVSDD